MEELNGWLNIDKPVGMTSAKVVSIIKRITGAKKVGHGGTLDPLASGVLPICLNKATKTTEKMMGFTKEYLFNITFGESRTTADAEGEINDRTSKIPTEQEILAIIPNFIGTIKQTPPAFSAIKVNGKRSYELARNGEEVKLRQRDVVVYDLRLLGTTDDAKKTMQFYVKCGKGFYVRSLCVDIAKAVGSLGYISYLRRLSVGVFNQDNILTLEGAEELYKINALKDVLINI